VCGGSQLGRAAQQTRCRSQRALSFDQRPSDIIVLRCLIPGYEISHFMLVAVDVIGHH